MHYVYILQSISDPNQFYTGLCKNVEARLHAHNAGQSPHTSKHRPWRLCPTIGLKNTRRQPHSSAISRAALVELLLENACAPRRSQNECATQLHKRVGGARRRRFNGRNANGRRLPGLSFDTAPQARLKAAGAAPSKYEIRARDRVGGGDVENQLEIRAAVAVGIALDQPFGATVALVPELAGDVAEG